MIIYFCAILTTLCLDYASYFVDLNKPFSLFMMPDKEKSIFSQNIRFLRKEKGLTLVALSRLTGISKSSLSEYEKGTSYPGLQVLEMFSRFYKWPIDDLLNRSIALSPPDTEESDAPTLFSPTESPELLQHEKYQFHVQLLQQRLDASAQRCQMYEQLLKSRESENKTLRIQIRLLEERMNMLSEKR